MAKNPIRIVNQDNAKNLQVAEHLHLQDSNQMRAVTRHFTENLTEAKIDILGPLPNGSSILRVTAKPINGDKVLKAHVEINLSGDELIQFMQRDAFYQHLASLKLSQYTGYVAEQKIIDFALSGRLFDVGYVKTGGRSVAASFRTIIGRDKRIVDGKIWAIQNDSGHGIDFLCEVSPYPPAPKYITMDAKATLRANYGNHATPNGPSLSDVQKNPGENLRTHLENALRDFEYQNRYHLSRDECRAFREILEELDHSPNLLHGYKVTVGLTNGFNVAGNMKYPDNMIVFSRIE